MAPGFLQAPPGFPLPLFNPPPGFPKLPPSPAFLAPGVMPLGAPHFPSPGLGNTSATSSQSNGAQQSDWAEYKDESGQTYYHNRTTKESSWEKPEALKSEFEKEAVTPWREYMDDQGRKYYVNSTTSETTWNMPEELAQYQKRLEEHQRQQEEAKMTPVERMLRGVFPEEPAKNNFARLLVLDRQMQSHWTWEQSIAGTFDDERSKQLKMADRKQVYQQLVQKLKIFEADERKRKEQQLLDDYYSMLDSWPEIDRYTSYREVSEKFETNPAFLAFGANDKERIRLFADYRQAKERKARAAAKEEQKKQLEAFENLLIDAKLSPQTSWKQFLESHSSHPLFQSLEAIDRLECFAHHIRTLERQEDEQLAATRYRNRTSARKAREAFRSLLLEKFTAPSHSISSHSAPQLAFDASTTWHHFLPFIVHEPRYQAMLSVSGSTPAELFYDYIAELHDRYAKERRKIKNLAKSLGLRVLNIPSLKTIDALPQGYDSEAILTTKLEETPRIDFKVWAQRLRNHVSTIDETTLKRLYQEFGARELLKAQGRIQRAQKKLSELILDSLASDPSFSFESLGNLSSGASDIAILSQNHRKAIFERTKASFSDPISASTTSVLELHATDSELVKGPRNAKRSRQATESASDSEGELTASADAPLGNAGVKTRGNKSTKLKEGETPH